MLIESMQYTVVLLDEETVNEMIFLSETSEIENAVKSFYPFDPFFPVKGSIYLNLLSISKRTGVNTIQLILRPLL
jgi:hypothetical protein